MPGVTRVGFDFADEWEGTMGESVWGEKVVGEGERREEDGEERGEDGGEEGRGAVIEKGICLFG